MPVTIRDLSKRDLRRFWSKVRGGSSDACWPWLGPVDQRGRPVFRCEGLGSRHLRVRRALYTLNVADLAADVRLEQTCRGDTCCNPLHCRPVHLCPPRPRGGPRKQRIPTVVGHKLTRDQADTIRRSPEKGVVLARLFHVSQSCISGIRCGHIWR